MKEKVVHQKQAHRLADADKRIGAHPPDRKGDGQANDDEATQGVEETIVERDSIAGQAGILFRLEVIDDALQLRQGKILRLLLEKLHQVGILAIPGHALAVEGKTPDRIPALRVEGETAALHEDPFPFVLIEEAEVRHDAAALPAFRTKLGNRDPVGPVIEFVEPVDEPEPPVAPVVER